MAYPDNYTPAVSELDFNRRIRETRGNTVANQEAMVRIVVHMNLLKYPDLTRQAVDAIKSMVEEIRQNSGPDVIPLLEAILMYLNDCFEIPVGSNPAGKSQHLHIC